MADVIQGQLAWSGNRPYITPFAYGATGDGITDDSGPLQAALTAASAFPKTGGLVFLPPGVYRLTRPLVLPNAPVSLIGCGMEVSVIKQTGDAHGIVGQFSGMYVDMPTTIRDLTICTPAPLGTSRRTALALAYQPLGWPSSVNEPTVVLENLSIRPEESTTPGVGWYQGITLSDAWNASLRNIFIHGDNANTGANRMAFGLRLSNRSLDVHITNLHVWNAAYGVHAGHDMEGLNIQQGLFIADDYGVVINTRIGDAAIPNKPLAVVRDSHFACVLGGIWSYYHPQSNFSGNLIYDRDPANHFRGIYVGGGGVGGGGTTTIIGNTILRGFVSVTGVKDGIVYDAPNGTIIGNIIDMNSKSIWLAGASSRTVCHSNRLVGGGPVLNQGQGNSVLNNL